MIFVDSSAWFAAVNRRDRHHLRATELLASHKPLITSEFVAIETWLLINSRIGFATAEQFLAGLRAACRIERIVEVDWQQSAAMARAFSDQTFSIVDRTSFAMMERLGITGAVSFDNDFVIYRYGPTRERAFEILR